VSWHKKIILAVKKKDIQDARIKLNDHLHKLNTEEKMLREKFPDYFLSAAAEENAFDVDFGGLPRIS
jgi:hypothetical protein